MTQSGTWPLLSQLCVSPCWCQDGSRPPRFRIPGGKKPFPNSGCRSPREDTGLGHTLGSWLPKGNQGAAETAGKGRCRWPQLGGDRWVEVLSVTCGWWGAGGWGTGASSSSPQGPPWEVWEGGQDWALCADGHPTLSQDFNTIHLLAVGPRSAVEPVSLSPLCPLWSPCARPGWRPIEDGPLVLCLSASPVTACGEADG